MVLIYGKKYLYFIGIYQYKIFIGVYGDFFVKTAYKNVHEKTGRINRLFPEKGLKAGE